MFILCKGKPAKEPFVTPAPEVSVYSLEELCYYIYNHIYTVTEDFFDRRLTSWLRDQAGNRNLAKKLETLIKKKNDLKDLVVTLMCACDYYKEEEIIRLVTVMDKISNLPEHEKNKLKADNFLRAGQYGKSLQEYKKLLHGNAAERFTTEEYGDLLHDQAIALFHVSSFAEAARGFQEAYARNQREESLNQYLYVLLICGEEEEFEREALSYGKTAEQIKKLKQNFADALDEGDNGEEDGDSLIERCKKELRDAYARK